MEDRFVVAAVRAALEPDAAGLLPGLAGAVDGPTLLSLAARHGVRALVLRALAGLAEIPPSLSRDDIRTRLAKTAATNLMALSTARRALLILRQEGIRAALAPTPQLEIAIAGIGAYEFGPLTLLVPPDQVERAASLLANEAGVIHAADGALLARAVELDIAGVPIAIPAAADRIDALCRRGSDRRWARLEYVVAAALAARTAALPDRAARARVQRLLTGSLARSPRVSAPRSRARRRSASARELWVAGFPSAYGGADTELDHQIDLLRDRGVDVHLVPMFGASDESRSSVLARGCHIHDYRPDVFSGKVVASFCNGEFLKALPDIMRSGPPSKVIWFNCMTWLFEREREAHARGWIDVFGFQSEYQRHALTAALETIGPVRTFAYRPYFNPRRAGWLYRAWNGTYSVGRVSRDDAAKYAPDTWKIFEDVAVPPPLRKKIYVLGFGANAAARIGAPPATLDCTAWAPGEVPALEFYRSIDTLIHKTGGSRENYPRAILEAYAHGVVPIAEKDFGLPEMIVHGETGFLTSDSRTMSDYAGMLAHHPDEHRRIAENGRRYLEDVLAPPAACWAGWKDVLE